MVLFHLVSSVALLDAWEGYHLTRLLSSRDLATFVANDMGLFLGASPIYLILNKTTDPECVKQDLVQ